MRTSIKALIGGKTEAVYTEILDALDTPPSPSALIGAAWQEYKVRYPNNPSINGRIFEYLICETLVMEEIQPFYYQAKFHHVPPCKCDIVLYDDRRPVVLSVKVSLLERYKQADLEGIALRQVYRQARQYLITLNRQEVARKPPRIDQR